MSWDTDLWTCTVAGQNVPLIDDTLAILPAVGSHTNPKRKRGATTYFLAYASG